MVEEFFVLASRDHKSFFSEESEILHQNDEIQINSLCMWVWLKVYVLPVSYDNWGLLGYGRSTHTVCSCPCAEFGEGGRHR